MYYLDKLPNYNFQFILCIFLVCIRDRAIYLKKKSIKLDLVIFLNCILPTSEIYAQETG